MPALRMAAIDSLRALSESVDIGVFLNVDHVGVDDDALIDAALGTGQPSLLMIDASDCFLKAIIERTSETVDRLTGEDVLVEAEPGTTGARRATRQPERRSIRTPRRPSSSLRTGWL